MKNKIKYLFLLGSLTIMVLMLTGCKDEKKSPKYNEKNPGEISYQSTSEENIAETEEGLEYANNEVLIVAKEGIKKSDIEKLAAEYNAEVIGHIEVTGDYQWKLNRSYSYEELGTLLEKLKKEDVIEDACIQSISEVETSTFTAPNDKRWEKEWDAIYADGENWGIEAVRAHYAWNYKEHMTPIRIGLIDNMFNTTHDDLRFAEVFYNPDDVTDNHGTHVAGIMAATHNNAYGITGVYPFGEGDIYGVATHGTSNKTGLFFWKAAFAELIVRDVKVINVSMGYAGADPYLAAQGNKDVQQAIQKDADIMGEYFEKLLQQGYDFVIAKSAGNGKGYYFKETKDGWKRLEEKVAGAVPGCDGMANWSHWINAIENKNVKDRIIVVGAAELNHFLWNYSYEIAYFSDTGNRVNVMAPGRKIFSTSYKDGYATLQGTSQAAPHVAGVAAILWSYNTGLTGARVKEIIVDSCKGELQEVEGSSVGMVNALAALADASDERSEGNPFKTEKGLLISKVYNQLHDVIPNVSVTVKNAKTGEVVGQTKTDEEGVFEFALFAGEYTLLMSMDGYENLEVSEIHVDSGLVTEVNARNMIMKVAVADVMIPEEKVMTIGEVDVIEPEILTTLSQEYKFLREYSFTWTSSNEAVATVTANGDLGIIRAKSKGETVITATLESRGKTITKATNLRVASQGRDTVLVLDISGSMRGTPMNEMKEAAIDFCEELLEDEYNNRVGLVFYDNEIYSTGLTNDLNNLIAHIRNVADGGTTNMEEAIATAKTMLDSQGAQDSIKNIVVMADGLPNEGATSDSGSMQTSLTSYRTDISYANAVIDTAQKAMRTYNVYSLGFFHDLRGDTLTFATDLMKQLTNKPDGYHQVEDAENLQFAFGDISEEISDSSKIIINIACPVDVSVTYNGETISSAKDNYNDSASFGTLQLLGSDQDIKVLSLKPGIKYDVQLTGTDVGKMDYSVNYLNENGDMTDSREFVSVPITPTTKITSNTDNSIEKMDLNIDEDGDGEIDIIWSARKNGSGEITYDNTPEPVKEVVEKEPTVEKSGLEIWQAVLIIISVLIVCGLIVILIVVLGKDKKESDEILMPEEEKNIIERRIANEEQSEERTEDKEVVSQAAIIVLSGPLAGAEIPLSEHKVIYIGKDAQRANIVFSGDFPSVSRLHCSITYEDKFKKYFVTDCSKNGTFYTKTKERLVKGKRTPVCAGVVISLGSDKATIQLK